MPTSPHQARKQPRQARAKATVDALLEACGQVLERHGLQGLNTNRVAERAGASIGSLYQYFPAKEALLQALADRERARLLAELVRLSGTAPLALPPQETASQDPLCDSLEAMVEAGLRHQFERPVMAQALEAHELTPASQAATEAFDHAVSALLGQQLAAWAQRQGRQAPPGIDASEPAPSWQALAKGLVGMARTLIHAVPAHPRPDSPTMARHRQAIVAAAMAYLGQLLPVAEPESRRGDSEC